MATVVVATIFAPFFSGKAKAQLNELVALPASAVKMRKWRSKFGKAR
jgi:hypothetical protein